MNFIFKQSNTFQNQLYENLIFWNATYWKKFWFEANGKKPIKLCLVCNRLSMNF